ncbi:MAG: NYN domain-containing protein [Elusimicrobiota bacterium]
MAVIYIIDAFNVIHSTSLFGEGPINSQKNLFFSFLNINKPSGSTRNRVIAVFDGRPFPMQGLDSGFVEVKFSFGKEADDVIKDLVDSMSNPSDAIVVTNDKTIQKWVKMAKARVISCEDFLMLGQKVKSDRKREKLDKTETDQINEEFKKLWNLK